MCVLYTGTHGAAYSRAGAAYTRINSRPAHFEGKNCVCGWENAGNASVKCSEVLWTSEGGGYTSELSSLSLLLLPLFSD